MEQHGGAEINVTCFKNKCLYQIKTQRDVFSSCQENKGTCNVRERVSL